MGRVRAVKESKSKEGNDGDKRLGRTRVRRGKF